MTETTPESVELDPAYSSRAETDASSRYVREELIGRGGVMAVFRGRDTVTGKTVAIKRSRPDKVAENPEIFGLVRKEAQLLQELDHPNIVKLLDIVESEQQIDIIMEFCEGGSLRELIDQNEPIAIQRILEIALDLADAVTRAHRLDMIHRDLKPDNVVIAADGTPRLSDFGLAWSESDRRPWEGSFIGTPRYMSPESIAGAPPSTLADIWSFGVMLFEMLSGDVPFAGDTADELREAISIKNLPELARLRPDTPPALVRLIQRMLEKDPRERVSSMRLVSAELEAIMQPGASALTPGEDKGPPDRSGAVIAHYVCDRRVGWGAFAEIYRGRDMNSGQTVAIKRSRPDKVAEHPEILDLMRQEGQLLQELNHPNILSVLDIVESEGQVDLVVEYLAGGSLRGLIDRDKPLPIRRILEIGLDLADALTRAHRLDVLHNELKPDQVMFAADSTLRLSDFMFSYWAEFDWLQQEVNVVGLLAYLSPELFAGAPLSKLTNIWAFGVLLFEMLTGEVPFSGDTVDELKETIGREPLPDLARMRPESPPALIALIERLLQKNPRERLPSMRLASAALEAVMRDETLTLGPQEDISAPADIASRQPTLLAGRFVQQAFFRSGGQGDVYLGRDLQTGEQVIIKRLKPEVTLADPALIARFKREGDLLRRLDHPNIVRVLDAIVDGGEHLIVMEYVPGGDLRDLLARKSQLPISQALSIALELADALSRTHHLGVIHRDLKPANVLLAEDGTPRLSDFGLARLRQSETRLTQTGTVMGSPIYMSPEACMGEEVGKRADIWSLGIMLYEMVAGRPPFFSENVTTVLYQILSSPTPNIKEIRADAPSALVLLLDQMLVKDPRMRMKSVRQVAAELEVIRSVQAQSTDAR